MTVAEGSEVGHRAVGGAGEVVADDYDGQRVDNFVFRTLPGAPRALIYRLIRTGRIRLNNKRVKPDSRVRAGDVLSTPASITQPPSPPPPPAALDLKILYEDAQLLAVDKPAGLAVHGGSGIAHGVIERLRAARREGDFLELAHRLDKETSGVLLLAKKMSALRAVQAAWRARQVRKEYVALVFGVWRRRQHARILLPLRRVADRSGNRRVVADSGSGKTAVTQTRLLRQYARAALVGAQIATGRTHQLRVHLADSGLPIVGDSKYGDFAANRRAPRAMSGRMFLHAAKLVFAHPTDEGEVVVESSVPRVFFAFGGEV